MSVMNNRFSWPWVPVITCLAIGSAWASERSKKAATDTSPVAEWMRGVPRGCRLVSFNLLDAQVSSLDSKDCVDVVLEYVTGDQQHQSATLLQNVGILDTRVPGIAEGAGSALRVTVALTPHQADRLRVAAACSPLRMRKAAISSASRNETPQMWNVGSIEDRTKVIEAKLAGSGEGKDILERPTLASPPGVVPGNRPRVIAVPIEVENRPY